MTPLEWLLGLLQWILGFMLGSILTGYFTTKVVVPRVMKNKDVQELVALFREGKAYLHEILENQKKRRGETDMELTIKKDGTILLLGKEIGKAPHTLENIKIIELVVAGPEGARIVQTIQGSRPASAEEIGLNISVE